MDYVWSILYEPKCVKYKSLREINKAEKNCTILQLGATYFIDDEQVFSCACSGRVFVARA